MDSKFKIGFIVVTCILLTFILFNSINEYLAKQACSDQFSIQTLEETDSAFIDEPVSFVLKGADISTDLFVWSFEGAIDESPKPDFSFATAGSKIVSVTLNEQCVYRDTIYVIAAAVAAEPVVEELAVLQDPSTPKPSRKPSPRPKQPDPKPQKWPDPKPPAPTPTIVYQNPVPGGAERRPKPKPVSPRELTNRKTLKSSLPSNVESCINFSSKHFSIVFSPKQDIKLTGLNVYVDGCGSSEIEISGRDYFDDSVSELTKGECQISLTNFSENLRAGTEYTIRFTAIKSRSCETGIPSFGNMANCSTAATGQYLNIREGADFIYNIKLNY